MLAHYTPQEARALEDHYIAGAKREGIWGMGRLPLSSIDKTRSKEAGTAAGLEKQRRSNERKVRVLKAVRDGHATASAICKLLNLSHTCVRRYLLELGELGLIEVKSVCILGGKTWIAVDCKKDAA
jgi:hypothetical protein